MKKSSKLDKDGPWEVLVTVAAGLVPSKQLFLVLVLVIYFFGDCSCAIATLQVTADHLLSIRLAGARFATFLPLFICLAVFYLSGNWESYLSNNLTMWVGFISF